MKKLTMKKLTLCLAAIAALLVTPVLAAPPTPAPVKSTSWSGLYVDGAFGEEWTRNTWRFNNTLIVPANPFSAPASVSTNNAVAGLHIGYQQQFNWLVVGGEFGGTMPFGGHTAATIPGVSPPCGAVINGLASACQVSVDSVMTAGGKLGYASGDWLAYAVGGAAFNAGIAAAVVSPNQASNDAGHGATAHGHYVGGGVDYRVAKSALADFIVGVEYRHIGLDTAQVCSTLAFVGNPGPCANNSLLERTVSTRQDLVWFKVTVLFNPLGW